MLIRQHAGDNVVIVRGGKERNLSVKNGINSIVDNSGYVAIHDGVRPFINKTFIEKMNFPNADVNLLDGVRVSYENSWGLLRASNTSPKLVLRFEGNSQDDLEDIKEKFETNLKMIFPDLELIYS